MIEKVNEQVVDRFTVWYQVHFWSRVPLHGSLCTWDLLIVAVLDWQGNISDQIPIENTKPINTIKESWASLKSQIGDIHVTLH